MIVTIDIGNSNTSFGVFSENGKGEPEFNGNIRTEKSATTEELAIKFLELYRLWGLEGADLKGKVIISSVVPQLDYEFLHMFEKYYKTIPYFITKDDIPLTINYDYPNEIGADRLVNSYAGSILYPDENLIIVDFGTATTFDIVKEGRSYEGGLIMTGIMTSLRALEKKASKLPHIDLNKPSALIGRNTIDGIRSGILYGTGAMVDGLTGRIAAEMKWEKYKVIATGGLSKLIKTSSESIGLIDRQLTLKGLYYLWNLKS
ncbi:MAG: type III pantothenate kinase [Brevinematales bacterium]|jgi:type III pantothenate kinase